MPSPPRPRRRPVALVAGAAALAVGLVAGCSGGGDDGPERTAAPTGPLVVCVAKDNPPLAYPGTGPGGIDVTGFEVELLNAMAQRLDRPLRVRPRSFRQVLAGVADGSCPVGAGSITVTAERRQQYAFTAAYLTEDRSVVVPAASPVRSRPALRGKVVGVLAGSVAAGRAEADLPAGAEVQPFANADGLYSALDAGAIAAVYADVVQNAAQQISRPDLRTVFVERSSTADAFAVRKGQDALVAQLDRALRGVRASGVYRDLHRRYFEQRPR